METRVERTDNEMKAREAFQQRKVGFGAVHLSKEAKANPQRNRLISERFSGQHLECTSAVRTPLKNKSSTQFPSDLFEGINPETRKETIMAS
ncbi:hypothetical protein V2J09_017751 [Rumex salicifolius]